MEFAWGELWNKNRNRLKAGWLITAGVIAICAGTVGPMDRFREEAMQRETGLGAVAFEPASMWHQTHLSAMLQAGVIGGVPGRWSEYVVSTAGDWQRARVLYPTRYDRSRNAQAAL